MEIADLATTPLVETTLLLAGFVAMTSAVVGRKKQSSWDEVLMFIGLIVGIFAIIVGIVAITQKDGVWPPSTIIVLFVVGLGLFLRILKSIKWAAIIALLLGIVTGYLLDQVATGLNITNILTPTVIIIAALIVMVIVYAMLKLFEDLISIAGGILSFRPVMFVAGVIAMFEGVLLIMGTSVSGLLP